MSEADNPLHHSEETAPQPARKLDLPGVRALLEKSHGRVDKMALTWEENALRMEWCLNCHRHPEQYVRPKEFITTMGYQPAGDQEEIGRRLVQENHIQDARLLTSCSTCHR